MLALACGAPLLVQASPANPTPHEVYEAARAGHLSEAQQMMNLVLKQHPQSGEAHYVAAELYAREGNYSAARSELATAETLAPGLPFAKSDSVQRLQRQLAQGRGTRAAPQYERSNSAVHTAVPWGLILIVVGAIAVMWAVVRRRSAAAVYQQYGGNPAVAGGVPPGYGPGPGYGPAGGGIGSGIAGGLASGLAVGAGVVAGEELAHRFLDGNQEGRVFRKMKTTHRRIPTLIWVARTSESPMAVVPGTTAAPSVVTQAVAETTGPETPGAFRA
jgi:hypothetical protein